MVLTLWKQCQVGGQCPRKSRAPFPALFALRGRKPRSEQQELGKVGPVALESCNTIYLFIWNMAWVVIYSNTTINAAAAIMVFHYPECSELCFPARSAGTAIHAGGLASDPRRRGITRSHWAHDVVISGLCFSMENISKWTVRHSPDSPGFASNVPSLNLLRLKKTNEVIDVQVQKYVPLIVLLTDWICLSPSVSSHRQNHGGAGVGRDRSAAECSTLAVGLSVLRIRKKTSGFFPVLSKAVCETNVLSLRSFVDTKVKKYLKTSVIIA